MPSAWPTSTDLQSYLTGAGISSSVAAGLNLTAAVNAAVRQFERQTDWAPFLSSGADEARYFDPQGPEQGAVSLYSGVKVVGGSAKLFLRSGLISLTSLAVGVSPANDTGTLMTVGTDFWLRPQNAPSYQMPYAYIEFRVPAYGDPQSIKIVGKWGYSLEVPDDAWSAVLRYAAASLAPQIATAISGGVSEVQDTDLRVLYGRTTSPFLPEAEVQQSYWQQVATDYHREGL